MTALHTVFDRGGPLSDHSHRRQTTATLVSQDTPAAPATATWTRHVNGRVIDRLIDRLCAETPPTLAGEPHAQFVRDLLGAPAFPVALGPSEAVALTRRRRSRDGRRRSPRG